MNKYTKAILCFAWMSVTSAYAQEAVQDSTLNRTVVVENEYNPEVMDAYKVNIMPKIEEPEIAKKEIVYAAEGKAFKHWQFNAMQPYTRRFMKPDAKRGYMSAAYGNRNNIDVKGGYLWDITPKDQLDLMGIFYGHSGKTDLENAVRDWNGRLFRGEMEMNYRHLFRKVAMDLGGSYAQQVYNYMIDNEKEYTPSQHLSITNAHVGIASTDKECQWQYGAEANLSLYGRKYSTNHIRKGTETQVKAKAYASYQIDKKQSAGVDLGISNLMYGTTFKDYTFIQLNPYYTLQHGNIRLRGGVHLDMRTGFNSSFMVSPDVMADFTFADSYVFYVKATGGTALNDYERLHRLTPYWNPESAQQFNATYTPLDASIGFKASPVPCLGFNIRAGYRMLDDEIFAMPEAYYTTVVQQDANVAYVGARLDYNYGKLFDMHLDGEFYNWDTKAEHEHLLVFKPQFKIDFNLNTCFIDHLNVYARYHFEQRKKIDGEKVNPVSELSLGADYQILEPINVFVVANNLFNNKHFTEYGIPAQGIYIMGGLSFRF